MTADTITILLMVVASSGMAYFAGYVSALHDEQARKKANRS